MKGCPSLRCQYRNIEPFFPIKSHVFSCRSRFKIRQSCARRGGKLNLAWLKLWGCEIQSGQWWLLCKHERAVEESRVFLSSTFTYRMSWGCMSVRWRGGKLSLALSILWSYLLQSEWSQDSASTRWLWRSANALSIETPKSSSEWFASESCSAFDNDRVLSWDYATLSLLERLLFQEIDFQDSIGNSVRYVLITGKEKSSHEIRSRHGHMLQGFELGRAHFKTRLLQGVDVDIKKIDSRIDFRIRVHLYEDAEELNRSDCLTWMQIYLFYFLISRSHHSTIKEFQALTLWWFCGPKIWRFEDLLV